MMGMAMMGHLVFTISLLLACSVHISAKECTNSIPSNSHTLSYEYFTSKNETWKKEMMTLSYDIHQDHVTPSDDSAWASLFPRKMLKEQGDSEFKWSVVYREMKHPGIFNSGVTPSEFLKETSLHRVRLTPGSMQYQAQKTNLEYLMMLDVDRLVWSFRKTAGLATPGEPYGGWEGPEIELRGHFVGHYLSATALMWASTHDEKLKQKMDTLVSALKECQDKMGNGYLSAFPTELFDRFEAVQPVWAPYYTIHKIMAGLLDQYTWAGSAQALKMLTLMADYFYDRVQNVIAKYSIERHWYSLNEEVGGMNDVLYKLYTVTGNKKHLTLAHLFDKPCFLGILAMKADHISGFHSNTHIPLVIGAQMRYEVTGDELYKEIGTYFMDIINSTHSYATGGTSSGEFWHEPMRLADQLGTETEESCTTYNMLKVSRNMFRWTKKGVYADYYERAVTNGVLSIQRGTDPGVMIYMLPLGHGVSKSKSYHGWGNSNNSFWCCYGTGIESFSKLGDSIYFQDVEKTPGLYVIQYISSSIDWENGKLSLNQKVEDVNSWDQRLQVTITVTPNKESLASTLNLRVPSWTTVTGASASLNGESLTLPARGNFLEVTRSWKDGDKISLAFPLSLRTETIEDDRPEFATLSAILYGPYLLAGLSDNGDYEIKTGPVKSISDWISPIHSSYNSQLISLSQGAGHSRVYLSNNKQSITMEPSPMTGSDASVHATFRIIPKASDATTPQKHSTPENIIGQVIVLEPFDYPGMVLSHEREQNGMKVTHASKENGVNSFEFRVVKGLDGKSGTISLQSESRKGCFVFGGKKAGQAVWLNCYSNLMKLQGDGRFEQGASFKLSKGLREYHPISFIAKGEKRNYVLEPLMSLRDEFYNVYFNIVS